MKKLLTLMGVLLGCTTMASAQIYCYSGSQERSNEEVYLSKIDNSGGHTVVYLTFVGNGKHVTLHPTTHLVAYCKGGEVVTYNYKKAENIAIFPEYDREIPVGQKVEFKIYFPKIADNVKKIDFIEFAPSDSTRFNFYNISLSKKFLEN